LYFQTINIDLRTKNMKGGDRLNLKAALLLVLVFACTVTATAVAFIFPTPAKLATQRNTVAATDSTVNPLGDPIDSPGVPG
jgi:Na+/serine symporter